MPGVLTRDGELIKSLSSRPAPSSDGTISGGMIPRSDPIEAIQAGVQGVVILNGKTAHAVLLEIFTEQQVADRSTR